ncbi:MAG: HAD family hydrolase [Alphaproteobacteria bacterium]|nr:MAG: HAD family hydrolase [Alphaproteobacteria bacterium]
MWSGPRNLSTAMMYAFAQRGDCDVWDEPFYAAYLKVSGAAHPMREEILAAHSADPAEIAARCAGPAPDGSAHFYQKHMTHHMLPGFDRGWFAHVRHVFLIRHPARVIASYDDRNPDPTLEDLGLPQQTALFAEITRLTGQRPLVIDSADIRAAPERMLRALCAALGLPFRRQMLSWPAGGHRRDGVWARHWYGAVHRSTGFAGPEGPLPALAPHLRPLLDAALPHYAALSALALKPGG